MPLFYESVRYCIILFWKLAYGHHYPQGIDKLLVVRKADYLFLSGLVLHAFLSDTFFQFIVSAWEIEFKPFRLLVVGIGKIEDIYVKSGISHAVHTGSNKEGLELTLKAVEGSLDLGNIKIADSKEPPVAELIFTNLVDTDMLFGHRNDWKGYGKAIEEIDAFLPKIMDKMTKDDILFVTADHGCDPTVPGTDHTREQVPLLVYSKADDFAAKDLGILPTFAYISDEVRKWFKL